MKFWLVYYWWIIAPSNSDELNWTGSNPTVLHKEDCLNTIAEQLGEVESFKTTPWSEEVQDMK